MDGENDWGLTNFWYSNFVNIEYFFHGNVFHCVNYLGLFGVNVKISKFIQLATLIFFLKF